MRKLKRETDRDLSQRRIVISSSDLNHRISKSGVLEPSSDVIDRGSGEAIGARPSRKKR